MYIAYGMYCMSINRVVFDTRLCDSSEEVQVLLLYYYYYYYCFTAYVAEGLLQNCNSLMTEED